MTYNYATTFAYGTEADARDYIDSIIARFPPNHTIEIMDVIIIDAAKPKETCSIWLLHGIHNTTEAHVRKLIIEAADEVEIEFRFSFYEIEKIKHFTITLLGFA